MGNIFTLDAMREEIEREFAPFQIEIEGKTLTLRNLLRIPRKNRDQVYALLDEMSDLQKNSDGEGGGLASTEKSAQIALHILPLVADNEKLANILVENIEDDLALSLRLFNAWMQKTQSGEAEGSPS
jgi:hypothetical protein